jgi:hypothetical protein
MIITDSFWMKLRQLFKIIALLPGFFFWGGLLTGVQAQKYSNEFLSIGVGARAQGLGNAMVANVDDIWATAWNPAGLANLSAGEGLQLGAMHSEWFGGVGKFDYLGFTLPLAKENRRLAFSLIRFGIDEIPNTLTLYESDGTVNFDNVTSFSAADYAFLISYGQQKLLKNGNALRLGGNVKIVHRRIGPFATAWGFGVDLGAQYSANNWNLGFLVKDITTTFNAWSFNFTEEEKEVLALTNNEIPINSVEITTPQFIVGVSRRFQLNKISLTPELDWIITSDGQRNTLLSADPFSLDPALGLEAGYNDVVFLRAGLNQFQRETDFAGLDNLTTRPSIGIGLELGNLQVDYAFTDLGDQQNTFSHVISLSFKIIPRK